MKKTYWWRIILMVISVATVLVLFAVPCRFDYWECFGGSHLQTMVIRMAFAIFIVSFFLFLVDDEVFKKWLKFTSLWIILEIIIIGTTDAHRYKNIGSDGVYSYRGYLSGILTDIFTLLSIVKISWDSFISRKTREGNGFLKNNINTKNTKLAIGHILSILILAVSYFFAWEFLFFIFLSICIILTILYFVKPEVVRMWLYFAPWFLILYVFMALTASKTNGGMIFPSDYEFITYFSPFIFIIISIFIVIFGAYKYRESKSLKVSHVVKKIITP